MIASTSGVGIGFSCNAFSRMLVGAVDGGTAAACSINALDLCSRKNGPRGDGSYIYSPDGLLLSECTNGQWANYIHFGGEPVAMFRGGVLRFMHIDMSYDGKKYIYDVFL